MRLCSTVNVFMNKVAYSRECSWPAQRGWRPSTLVMVIGGWGRGGEPTVPLKNTSLCHYTTYFFFWQWLHFLGVSFVTNLKSHLCTSRTTQNTTEIYCIISLAHNTTSLQSNVLLSGIYIGYWSQTWDGRLSPAQTTAKANCKIHSKWLYSLSDYFVEVS